jgi:threonine dehydrogenase-like Zn-dependent dehydrogenase
MKEIDIRGSRGSDKQDFEDVLSVVRAGKLDPEQIVSHTFTFDKADEAIQLWASDPSKVTKIVIEL